MPKGLEVKPDAQPLDWLVASHLEALDALLQSMQSRVTRLSAHRGVQEDADVEGGVVSALHPHLRLFVERPPEGSFAATKAARGEMEVALALRREADDDGA